MSWCTQATYFLWSRDRKGNNKKEVKKIFKKKPKKTLDCRTATRANITTIKNYTLFLKKYLPMNFKPIFTRRGTNKKIYQSKSRQISLKRKLLFSSLWGYLFILCRVLAILRNTFQLNFSNFRRNRLAKIKQVKTIRLVVLWLK